jgi:hypothetical protein
MLLQVEIGKVCSLFSQHSEDTNSVGLTGWPEDQRLLLANALATVCALLGTLANMCSIALSQCIGDKFAKNAAKYPADRSRGSSAKYTAYISTSTASTSDTGAGTGSANSVFQKATTNTAGYSDVAADQVLAYAELKQEAAKNK